MSNQAYCESLLQFKRRETRTINIGDVPMGSLYPIRVQTMTNTLTLDTKASVEQCIRVIEAGAEYVRLTTPTVGDAENLKNIKQELLKHGYKTPLVADVHFNPKVAEVAAAIVEKVRINPGNYIDKKQFQQLDYTESAYNAELEKIADRIAPLLKICNVHGTAIRIGVNHGSLSDRIMSRYGDTPEGMAESALEFLRICEHFSFYNTVISLKASNTRIMVQAYRLLINRMLRQNMNYPLHLGVTEAGEGEDGRIKSAVGIGALLCDGIGDTIRVSLTEEPENEIPVARKLVDYFNLRSAHAPIEGPGNLIFDPFVFKRTQTHPVADAGNGKPPIVIGDYCGRISEAQKADWYYLCPPYQLSGLPTGAKSILDFEIWDTLNSDFRHVYPLFSLPELLFFGRRHQDANFLRLTNAEIADDHIKLLACEEKLIIIIESFQTNSTADLRALIARLRQGNCLAPVVVGRMYSEELIDDLQIKAASDCGELFIDGLADGIWLRNTPEISEEQIISLSFGILQASRLRSIKTEYISCPSCGRTLFDLQSVTAQIRQKTSHLKHLKIAIMGCIVNGPGEMADADYGYVGAGPGQITLYKNREVVHRNIPSSSAVDELVALIKENGDWVEPV